MARQRFLRESATDALLFAIALLGCAQPPPPEIEIDTGPGAEVSADGLYRVTNPVYREAWVKPDADFASYSQVLLDPVEIAYKREPRKTRYRGTESNFALTAKQMSDLKRYFTQAFEKELAGSSAFELVEVSGPRVLRVQAAIIDLVVKVPTETLPGSQSVFTTSTGEMTLLLELRDALSGEILARVVDRREARAVGRVGSHDLYHSSAVTNTDAVGRVVRRRAQILRAHLDQIRALPPSETPPE
jgi:hypothetical protein